MATFTPSGDCLGEKLGAERVYFMHPVQAYSFFKVIEVSMWYPTLKSWPNFEFGVTVDCIIAKACGA